MRTTSEALGEARNALLDSEVDALGAAILGMLEANEDNGITFGDERDVFYDYGRTFGMRVIGRNDDDANRKALATFVHVEQAQG